MTNDLVNATAEARAYIGASPGERKSKREKRLEADLEALRGDSLRAAADREEAEALAGERLGELARRRRLLL